MPEWPHWSAIRLQQSRSAAVITAPGSVQAITGSAAISTARAEIPIFTRSLTPISLFLTVVRGNHSAKFSNYAGFLSGVAICLYWIDKFANKAPSVEFIQKKEDLSC